MNPSATEGFFMKKNIFFIVVLLLLFIGIGSFSYIQQSKQAVTVFQPTTIPSPKQQNTFSYKGEAGKDALTLLKSQTKVEQDKSGLVVSIAGRKADNAKKEFWAFFVNGKEAEVGPASYQTKKSDKIDWKIMTY
jgi:hypothetical protein